MNPFNFVPAFVNVSSIDCILPARASKTAKSIFDIFINSDSLFFKAFSTTVNSAILFCLAASSFAATLAWCCCTILTAAIAPATYGIAVAAPAADTPASFAAPTIPTPVIAPENPAPATAAVSLFPYWFINCPTVIARCCFPLLSKSFHFCFASSPCASNASTIWKPSPDPLNIWFNSPTRSCNNAFWSCCSFVSSFWFFNFFSNSAYILCSVCKLALLRVAPRDLRLFMSCNILIWRLIYSASVVMFPCASVLFFTKVFTVSMFFNLWDSSKCFISASLSAFLTFNRTLALSISCCLSVKAKPCSPIVSFSSSRILFWCFSFSLKLNVCFFANKFILFFASVDALLPKASKALFFSFSIAASDNSFLVFVKLSNFVFAAAIADAFKDLSSSEFKLFCNRILFCIAVINNLSFDFLASVKAVINWLILIFLSYSTISRCCAAVDSPTKEFCFFILFMDASNIPFLVLVNILTAFIAIVYLGSLSFKPVAASLSFICFLLISSCVYSFPNFSSLCKVSACCVIPVIIEFCTDAFDTLKNLSFALAAAT